MGERLTPRTLRRHGYRRGDMSVPTSALPSDPPPDRPRSSFYLTIDRLEELRHRIREEEGDWTRVQILKREQEELLIGVLSRGFSEDLPSGTGIRFAPSDSDPTHSLHITVLAQNEKYSYYLKDRAAKTPAQLAIINRTREIIRSRAKASQ